VDEEIGPVSIPNFYFCILYFCTSNRLTVMYLPTLYYMMPLRNAVLLIYISVQRHRVITGDEFFKILKTWISLAALGYFRLPAPRLSNDFAF